MSNILQEKNSLEELKDFYEYCITHDIHEFIKGEKITNDQGELLDFKNHPFLYDIFCDFAPRQAVRKAAQVGFSTTANIKAMWLAKNKNLDIIYSLPTFDDVKQFVSGKTNRLIANNPPLQKWTEDKDSIEQKRIGTATLYFKGTWTERAALMIPADLYIADEVDRSKQDIVSAFSSRLQHSKFQWEWHFSNPSAPGVGVDKMWEESDQKHWFVKCECGNEGFLTMENIMGSPAYFGCVKCKKELNRRRGRWIKRWKDKKVSGYWISLLMCPWVSAERILEYKKTKSEDYFDNMVLGIPHVGKGNTLPQQLFFANLTTRPNPMDAKVFIGIDTGTKIKVVAGNKYGIFYYDTLDDWPQVERLMEQWPTSVVVIDQGGDLIGPRKLREKYPGRVYLCFFRADQKNDKIISWNDEDNTVIVDRNRIIQTVIDEYRERRIPMFGTEADWWDCWLEWKKLYRTSEENTLGVLVHKWNKADIPCDFPFSTVYWRICADRFMDSQVFFAGGESDFAQQGLDVLPNGQAFIPRIRYS